jgi:hypothetical protein
LFTNAFWVDTKVAANFSGISYITPRYDRQRVRTYGVAGQNICSYSAPPTGVIGVKGQHTRIGCINIGVGILWVWCWGVGVVTHNKSIQWAFILGPYQGIVPYFWEEYLDYNLDVFNLWVDLR